LVDISIIILKDIKLPLLLHKFTIVSRVFLISESIGLCIKLKKEVRENLWGAIDNRVYNGLLSLTHLILFFLLALLADINSLRSNRSSS
jgi:hypothetical protein